MKHPELELVGVNELVPADNLAYLFKYDSTRTYPGTVAAQPDGILIDDCFVSCMAIKDPAELPWRKLGADYVVKNPVDFLRLMRVPKNTFKLGQNE